MSARRHNIIVTPAAQAMRAAVGPYAWVVLEELASGGCVEHGRVVVEASVRALASSTGLSKDAVARAVSRLIDAGVVERVLNRDTESGRFGRSVCTLHVGLAGIEIVPSDIGTRPSRSDRTEARGGTAGPTAAAVPVRVPAKREPARCEGQLSFLDDAGTVA